MADIVSRAATRRRSLLAYAAFLVTLIAGSSQRIVGDGVEYFAMAWSLAETGRPSVSASGAGAVQHALVDAAPQFADVDLATLGTPAADGRRDLVHFWLYSALAAPLLRVNQLAGVLPTWAFVVLNAALLLLAFAVTISRLGPALTALVFAGPIVWWIDKVHTEVFIFSMLTVAFVLVRDAPAWSMVACGAAAAQNPPIAVFLPLVLAGVWVGDRARLRSARLWMGTAAGAAIALLHPA